VTERLKAAALASREPDPADALALLASPDDALPGVVAAADEVRRRFFGNRVKMNFLFNMKSGLCPEDCHYCSQRRGSEADILRYPMLDAEAAVEAATRAVGAGAKRLCMVASGRGPTEQELNHVANSVEAVKATYPTWKFAPASACLRRARPRSYKRRASTPTTTI